MVNKKLIEVILRNYENELKIGNIKYIFNKYRNNVSHREYGFRYGQEFLSILMALGYTPYQIIEKLELNTLEGTFFGAEDLKSITIPYGITCIGDSAFHECKNLETVIIPDSVTEIGAWAFGSCKSLKKIILPQSLIKIGRSAFFDSGLEEINIPNNVIEIGEYAFNDCFELKKVRLPESLITIGSDAFWQDRKLEKINIPKNLLRIGRCAFDSCESLKVLDIPHSVTEIDYRAFRDCKDLVINYDGSKSDFDNITQKYKDIYNDVKDIVFSR